MIPKISNESPSTKKPTASECKKPAIAKHINPAPEIE
jgi:hypothetical protein